MPAAVAAVEVDDFEAVAVVGWVVGSGVDVEQQAPEPVESFRASSGWVAGWCRKDRGRRSVVAAAEAGWAEAGWAERGADVVGFVRLVKFEKVCIRARSGAWLTEAVGAVAVAAADVVVAVVLAFVAYVKSVLLLLEP